MPQSIADHYAMNPFAQLPFYLLLQDRNIH